MKLIAIIIAAVALAIASPSERNATPVNIPAKKKAAREVRELESLVLLYTSCARGQIRSCNCTKFQFGGYGRELTLLKSIRKANDNVVLLEGGDAAAGDDFQAKLKAEVTASALELLGYGTMVPGEYELGKGGVRYLDYFDPKSVPVVCANVPDVCEKEAGYAEYVILTTEAGMRVGVIGLLDDAIEHELKRRMISLSISDPVKALNKLVPEVRAKSDLLIVLYHGTSESAGRLAAVDGTDLVLCTHLDGRNFLFPDKSTNEVNAPIDRQRRAYVVQSQTSTNWSLGRIDLTLGQDGRIKGATHKLFYLDRRYDEDPAMVKIYDSYNDKVTQAVLDQSKKMKEDMEVMLIKRGIDVDKIRDRLHKSPFAGDDKCKQCHADIHASWSKTSHARAMDTLDKTNQGFDPECVRCHVTGATTRHGFSNKKETPELINVQCEACHGPGLKHAESPKPGYGLTGEETCRSCHTSDKTPDFDVYEGWEKIKHQGQESMM